MLIADAAAGKLHNSAGAWTGAAIAFAIFGLLLIYKKSISRDTNGNLHKAGARKVGVALLVVALCALAAFTVP